MSRRIARVLVLVAAGLMTGCASAGGGSSVGEASALIGVEWRWAEFQGMDDTTIRVPDPERFTIEFFADGTYGMRADCNVGRGSYTRDGASLTLEPGPLTLAACSPGSLSDRYLRDLGYVRSLVIQDGQLYLALFADGGIMRFSPAAP